MKNDINVFHYTIRCKTMK